VGSPVKFFAGPKDFDVLTANCPGVTRAITFACFEVIAVPLLRSLKWINGYVANYGWADHHSHGDDHVLIFPYGTRVFVSSARCKEIPPEVEYDSRSLRQDEGTDPASRRYPELMRSIKSAGHPAAAACRSLLTFHVVFAFYALLSTAIELRVAPFRAVYSRKFCGVITLLCHPWWGPHGSHQPLAAMDMPATASIRPSRRLGCSCQSCFMLCFVCAGRSGGGGGAYWLVSNVPGRGPGQSVATTT